MNRAPEGTQWGTDASRTGSRESSWFKTIGLLGVTGLAACGASGVASIDEVGAGGATVVQPADQALGSSAQREAQIDLGHKLFFDENLSRPKGISCGTCHDPFLGWGDDRPQGKGIQDNTLSGDTDGDGTDEHNSNLAVQGNYFKTILTGRNTPTIYNSSVFGNLFWDGRAGALSHQAAFPFESTIEMNSSWQDHILPTLKADAEYRALFEAAYGTDRVSRQRAVEAIGAFEETISAFDTPYDDYVAGDLTALSDSEKRGMDLFFDTEGPNCVRCHTAPMFTDFGFHNTGVPSAGTFALNNEVDLGRGKFTDLTQNPPVEIDNPADYAKFKTPQLRMLSVTGPYMHNGAFATLEEVVDFYDQGGGPDLSGTGSKDALLAPLGLSAQDKADLVAFLRSGLLGTEIK